MQLITVKAEYRAEQQQPEHAGHDKQYLRELTMRASQFIADPTEGDNEPQYQNYRVHRRLSWLLLTVLGGPAFSQDTQ